MKFLAFLLALLASAAVLAQGAPPVQDWTKTATLTAPGTVIVGASGTSATQLQVTGSGAGMSFKIQGTVDNSTWFDLPAFTSDTLTRVAAGTVLSANGNWVAYGGGLLNIRANFTALASGSSVVYLRSGSGEPTAQSSVTAITVPGTTTTLNPDIATVTTGGTAVNAFSAGHCKYGCYVQNPDNATQFLCGNDLGTAVGTHSNNGTICVSAGQSLGFAATPLAISVVSSDSSHPFAGKGSQ